MISKFPLSVRLLPLQFEVDHRGSDQLVSVSVALSVSPIRNIVFRKTPQPVALWTQPVFVHTPTGGTRDDDRELVIVLDILYQHDIYLQNGDACLRHRACLFCNNEKQTIEKVKNPAKIAQNRNGTDL